MAAPPPVRELQASPRILYTALFAGVVFLAPIIVALRLVTTVVDLPEAVPVLRIAAVVLLVVLALTARRLRERMAPLGPGGDENAWWNAHLGSALIVWALSEGVALLGSVLFFVTGDVLMLVLLAGGFVLLVQSRPSRLMDSA
jgi:hypothetical protein